MRTNPVRDTQAVSSTPFTSSNGFNGIYVGTTGTLVVTEASGQTQTYTNIAAGMWHPIQGKGIAAGTTAGGLVVGLS